MNSNLEREDARAAEWHVTEWHLPRLSLRDWFAGQALAGILAAEAHPDSVGIPHSTQDMARVWAGAAYGIADAMLAARDAKAA